MYINVNRIIYAIADYVFLHTKILHPLLFEFLHEQ